MRYNNYGNETVIMIKHFLRISAVVVVVVFAILLNLPMQPDSVDVSSASKTLSTEIQQDSAGMVMQESLSESAPNTIMTFLMSVNWEALGFFLAFGGILVGWYVSQRNKRRLTRYLTKIDDVYVNNKMDAEFCRDELELLREKVDDNLKRGEINETTYELLLKRIDLYQKELMKKIIQQNIHDLPQNLTQEVTEMLQDGEVTPQEYQRFMELMKTRGLVHEQGTVASSSSPLPQRKSIFLAFR